MAKFDYETATKGILQAIKGYGDLQAERAQITAAIMGNEIKARQNLLYRLQEKELENSMTERLFNRLNTQGNFAENDIGGISTSPYRLEPGTGGQLQITRQNPTQMMRGVEFGHKYLDSKEARGLPLSAGETKWREKYPKDKWLKAEKTSPSDWDIRKEARTTVNMLLNNNFALQAQAMKDPNLIENMIRLQEEKIRQNFQDKINTDFQSTDNNQEINLPNYIETTSQARTYLMHVYKMDEDQATEWIRNYASTQR